MKELLNNFRGLISDWFLHLALQIAPSQDKSKLARYIIRYLREVKS